MYMPIQDFKQIFAWQKAHELTLEAYKLTKKYPKEELYGLVSQSRRAAVSVSSNLAEGFKRRGKADDAHFGNIAQGSLEELRYQLLLAKDLGYISTEEFNIVEKIAIETSGLIHLWIKSKDKK